MRVNKQTLASLTSQSVFAALLLFHAGCVAMNIPSQRQFDAADDGGILGGWTKPKRLGVPTHDVPASQHVDQTVLHHFGEVVDDPMTVDADMVPYAGTNVADNCLGPAEYLDGPPAGHEQVGGQSQVPWPRFHPVPTRPVFRPPGMTQPM